MLRLVGPPRVGVLVQLRHADWPIKGKMAIISRSCLLLTVLIKANLVLSEDYQGAWRNSLEGSSDSCWASNVSECYRVMSIVHGGDWNFQYPYDSFPAMQAVNIYCNMPPMLLIYEHKQTVLLYNI